MRACWRSSLISGIVLIVTDATWPWSSMHILPVTSAALSEIPLTFIVGISPDSLVTAVAATNGVGLFTGGVTAAGFDTFGFGGSGTTGGATPASIALGGVGGGGSSTEGSGARVSVSGPGSLVATVRDVVPLPGRLAPRS